MPGNQLFMATIAMCFVNYCVAFALVRKDSVLLRADFVLTKDLNWPYEGQFLTNCGKIVVVK